MDALRHNRGVVLVEGILFTILGVLAVAAPVVSTLATELFIGWLLIIAGIVQGYRTFKERQTDGFYISLFSAIVNLVLGVLLLVYPVAGMVSLTLLLTFYFILEGIAKIVLGFQTQTTPKWGWIIFSGVLSLLMAFLIYQGWPSTAFWVIGLLVGINMIFFGIAMISLASAIPKEPPAP